MIDVVLDRVVMVSVVKVADTVLLSEVLVRVVDNDDNELPVVTLRDEVLLESVVVVSVVAVVTVELE